MFPLLLLCLALHNIFGLGTVERKNICIPGAFRCSKMKEISLDARVTSDLPESLLNMALRVVSKGVVPVLL